MSLPNSLQRKIKEEIRNRISNLDSVAKVYTYDHFPFEQFPSVTILNGDIEGEFWSTAENRRTYAYRILVFWQIGQDVANVNNDRMQEAEEIVAKVVEDIMNVLDSDYELGQFNADVLYLDAVDMINLEYRYEGGWAKGAQLTVRVHTDYEV